MRIAVIGVGAVGGYFGGRLAQVGADVTFIARGATLAALREHGLQLTSINGDAHIQPVQATDNPAGIGAVDMVLIGVKSWQLAGAIEAARPLLGTATGVLPLLNGVEAADSIAAALGAAHTLNGICFIYAQIAAPGHIHHHGMEPLVTFGERNNVRSKRVEQLRSAFAAAGVRADVPPDITLAVWRKFLFGAPTSGLGAATRTSLDLLRGIPQTRALLEGAAREIAALAQARGIALDDDDVAAMMARVDDLPPNTTASMQRDIMSGRPSELEAQTGAVVRLGATAGMPTPINSFIYNVLLPQELRARGELV